jgi:hypothetical protein
MTGAEDAAMRVSPSSHIRDKREATAPFVALTSKERLKKMSDKRTSMSTRFMKGEWSCRALMNN